VSSLRSHGLPPLNHPSSLYPSLLPINPSSLFPSSLPISPRWTLSGQVRRLQTLLESDEFQGALTRADGRPVRIFVEGAFDLMHYGHANAFRQAKRLGTFLVAGVNSSETVEACRGAPPIMTDEERLAVVAACKWVDEVIPRTPYVVSGRFNGNGGSWGGDGGGGGREEEGAGG